ncbi:MAG: hypothetical protein JSS96_08610 [Bacteroidetes bacterium]|nr:hypothetical protein [Bacteroidota bacterium]
MNGLAHTPRSINIRFYSAVMIGALLLMLPAFYNGYPLLNGDSAIYLQFGFKALTPFEKSITYGLLVWLSSLNGLSLWPVIFFQACISELLIIKVYTRFIPGTFSLGHLWPLILLLLSGLPWVVCQLQPDIFISIALLASVLIITNKETTTKASVLYLIFFMAIATHIALVPLFTVSLFFIFLFRKKFTLPANVVNKTTRISMLILLTITSMVVMGPSLLRSRQVYMLSSLLQHGTLKQFLNDSCNSNNYKLCKYKDALPANTHYFLWDENSPLNKEGGLGAMNSEINHIIHVSFTSHQYLIPYLKSSTIASLKQLVLYTAADSPPFNSTTDVYAAVSQYLPHELASFSTARQNTTGLSNVIQVYNYLGIALILISLLLIAARLVTTKTVSINIQLLTWFCCTLIVFNALECGIFSSLNGRYSSRVLWLLPLCAILSLKTKRKPLSVS